MAMTCTVVDASCSFVVRAPPVTDVVVRVRGTFIDINTTVPTQSRRSCSAPPSSQQSAQTDANASNHENDSRYIPEGIERAMHLRDFHSSSQNDTFDGKSTHLEEVVNVESKMLLEEEKGHNGISRFGAKPMPTPNAIGEVPGSPAWDGCSVPGNVWQPAGERLDHCLCPQLLATEWSLYSDVKGPPTTSIGQHTKSPSKPRWHEESDFSDDSYSLGLWSTSTVTPITRANSVASTVDSKCEVEDPGPYKRLNLTPSGPGQVSNTSWLEENILSKQPHHETPSTSQITTLMICDIPCRQTIDQVIDAINSQGFANTFNLVHMPSKRPKTQNRLYASVNFKTAQYATAFGQTFQNFSFPNSSSKKLSYTKPALHQGYTKNVERYVEQGAVGCLVTFDDAVNGGEAQMWRQ